MFRHGSVVERRSNSAVERWSNERGGRSRAPAPGRPPLTTPWGAGAAKSWRCRALPSRRPAPRSSLGSARLRQVARHALADDDLVNRAVGGPQLRSPDQQRRALAAAGAPRIQRLPAGARLRGPAQDPGLDRGRREGHPRRELPAGVRDGLELSRRPTTRDRMSWMETHPNHPVRFVRPRSQTQAALPG
jgi:hypothetical protein